MQRTLTLRCALCAAAAALLASPAVAQQRSLQRQIAYAEQQAYGSDSQAYAEEASYDIDDSSIQPAQFSVQGGGGLGLGANLFDGGCGGQFYFGGEYLYVRANYSQAISYLTQDLTDPAQPRLVFNQFDFNYDDCYRFYGGYRLCDCGGDIRFTYTKLASDAAFQSPTVPGDQSLRFFSPLEVVADLPGTSLNGRASVELQTYDIEFGKTIPLGCPLGCCDSGCCDDGCCDDGCCDSGCCDSSCCDSGCCGDGCGCGCCCPAWDISWRAGVRIADLDSNFLYDNTIPGSAPLEQTSVIQQTFEGAGVRWGMTGRRYFGKRGIGSVYVKGDLSLLLGDNTIIAQSQVGNAFARHEISCTHIIPVTEIEVGGTVSITNNISVSGGYFFAAWHDLGNRVEYPFSTQPTGVQLESYDDANILGWDGFFVRGEVAF